MSAVFGVPVDAAYHLVLALSNVLTPVLGGLAAVAGIVVFTMAVRLLVVPLGNHWLGGAGLLTAQSAVFLAVFAVLAIACWLSGMVARRAAAGPATQPSGASALIGKILPFVTVVIAAFARWPAGST